MRMLFSTKLSACLWSRRSGHLLSMVVGWLVWCSLVIVGFSSNSISLNLMEEEEESKEVSRDDRKSRQIDWTTRNEF